METSLHASLQQFLERSLRAVLNCMSPWRARYKPVSRHSCPRLCFFIILYYTILYYTILCYAMLYYTILFDLAYVLAPPTGASPPSRVTSAGRTVRGSASSSNEVAASSDSMAPVIQIIVWIFPSCWGFTPCRQDPVSSQSREVLDCTGNCRCQGSGRSSLHTPGNRSPRAGGCASGDGRRRRVNVCM